MKKFLFIPILFLFNIVYSQQVDLMNEDFSNGFPANWVHYYSDWGGEKWAIDSGALRENSGPYFGATTGRILLPAFDLTTVSLPFLQFDFAMAVTFSNIQFSLQYTRDSTWNTLLTYADTTTAITVHNSLDNNWKPLSTDYETISVDLAQFENDTNIRFSFLFDYQNAWASGVWYFDNVKVAGNSMTTGIYNTTGPLSFRIFPNPTSKQVLLEFDNEMNEPHHLQLYDEVGRLIMAIDNIVDSKISLNLADQASGIYVFRLSNLAGKSTTGKIMKE